MKPGLLFVSDHLPYPTHYNGSSTINGNLLPFLAEAFDVHYCCLADENHNQADSVNTKEMTHQLYVHKVDQQNSIIVIIKKLLCMIRFLPHEAVVLQSSSMQKTIARLVESNTIDIIFSDLHFHAPHFLITKKIKVVSPHDSRALLYKNFSDTSSNIFKKIYYLMHSKVLKKYEKETFSHFDQVLFVSDTDSKYAEQILAPTKISFIPNGVSLDHLFKPKRIKFSDAPDFVFSGNLDYKPNREAVEYLCVNFMPAMREILPDSKLTIIGKCENVAWQRVLTKSRNTQFLGHVENVVASLSQHDIYICPLASGAGFKNKVLDAMAAGLPVIGTPLSFDGMIFTKDEVIRSPLETFVNACESLLSEPAMTLALAKSAQAMLVQQYAWSNIAKQYIHLLTKLLKTNPS